MLKRLIFMALLFSPVATWAFIKPVRVIAPELNGVSCVTDNICVDDIANIKDF